MIDSNVVKIFSFRRKKFLKMEISGKWGYLDLPVLANQLMKVLSQSNEDKARHMMQFNTRCFSFCALPPLDFFFLPCYHIEFLLSVLLVVPKCQRTLFFERSLKRKKKKIKGQPTLSLNKTFVRKSSFYPERKKEIGPEHSVFLVFMMMTVVFYFISLFM